MIKSRVNSPINIFFAYRSFMCSAWGKTAIPNFVSRTFEDEDQMYKKKKKKSLSHYRNYLRALNQKPYRHTIINRDGGNT